MYGFSRSLTQNFLCRPTMVPDILEDFEPPAKNFLDNGIQKCELVDLEGAVETNLE